MSALEGRTEMPFKQDYFCFPKRHATFSQRHSRLGPKRLCCLEQALTCVFALCPVSLIAPGPIVGLGPLRRKHLPRLLEVGARLVERRRGPGHALAELPG